jgi:hypothetical protein
MCLPRRTPVEVCHPIIPEFPDQLMTSLFLFQSLLLCLTQQQMSLIPTSPQQLTPLECPSLSPMMIPHPKLLEHMDTNKSGA